MTLEQGLLILGVAIFAAVCAFFFGYHTAQDIWLRKLHGASIMVSAWDGKSYCGCCNPEGLVHGRWEEGKPEIHTPDCEAAP